MKEQDMNNILSLKLIVTYVIKKTATTFEEAIQRARYKQYLIPRIDSNVCDKKKKSHNMSIKEQDAN